MGTSQDGDGAVGAVLLVEAQHLGVVHLVDVVAGEDQHVVRVVPLDEVDVLVDGVGGAACTSRAPLAGLIGRQHMRRRRWRGPGPRAAPLPM